MLLFHSSHLIRWCSNTTKIIKSISKISGFEKLATKKKNKAILALPKKDEKVSRSFRNIPGLKIYETRNLNVLDLLTYKYLILTEPQENLSLIS